MSLQIVNCTCKKHLRIYLPNWRTPAHPYSKVDSGVLAWTYSLATNGFLETTSGHFGSTQGSLLGSPTPFALALALARNSIMHMADNGFCSQFRQGGLLNIPTCKQTFCSKPTPMGWDWWHGFGFLMLTAVTQLLKQYLLVASTTDGKTRVIRATDGLSINR